AIHPARIPHHHLVPQHLQLPRHPRRVRARLQNHPAPLPAPQVLPQPRPRRHHTPPPPLPPSPLHLAHLAHPIAKIQPHRYLGKQLRATAHRRPPAPGPSGPSAVNFPGELYSTLRRDRPEVGLLISTPRLRVRCCSPRPLRRAPREPLAGPPARDATALPAPAPAPALAPPDSTHRRLRGMRMFGEPRATRSQLSTPQRIYVMKDLRKVVPPSREVLKGIWLSFYPGAKIGVVGPNGSGKSTLLRIMAGVDTDFQGEA